MCVYTCNIMRISPNPPRLTTPIIFGFNAAVTLGAGCLDPRNVVFTPWFGGSAFQLQCLPCYFLCVSPTQIYMTNATWRGCVVKIIVFFIVFLLVGVTLWFWSSSVVWILSLPSAPYIPGNWGTPMTRISGRFWPWRLAKWALPWHHLLAYAKWHTQSPCEEVRVDTLCLICFVCFCWRRNSTRDRNICTWDQRSASHTTSRRHVLPPLLLICCWPPHRGNSLHTRLSKCHMLVRKKRSGEANHINKTVTMHQAKLEPNWAAKEFVRWIMHPSEDDPNLRMSCYCYVWYIEQSHQISQCAV